MFWKHKTEKYSIIKGNNSRRNLGMEQYAQYAPLIVVIIAYVIQFNIFETPASVEKRHRLIMKDVEEKYVTKETFESLVTSVTEKIREGENRFASKENMQALATDISDMKNKIDKMYDYVIRSSFETKEK